MSLFDYVMILISMVLSLGIARILDGHASLLKRRSEVRWSPTYLLWLIIILACHIDLWGSLWMLRDAPAWNLSSLLVVFGGATALFYAAVLSAAEATPGGRVDLWTFHMNNRRGYIGALIGYLILGAVINMTLLSGHFEWATFAGALPSLGLCLVAIFVRNRWVQITVPILIASLLAVYFVSYFSTLQT